jgi:tripartite-type tricarboxylate transporter receptor subunit TctC
MTGATYALQYDLLKDFVPVALISTYPFVLVAKNTMPANDLKSLIAWLKANPDKASVGNGGNGSIAHVAGVLFRMKRARAFSSCLIAASPRPSRTWWQVRLTW